MKRGNLHMKLRHMAAIGATAVTLSVGPTIGTANADPAPSPVPSWVDEARWVVADALQRDGYDPARAMELTDLILGHYLP
jgi:hypothetical protein